MYDDLKKKHLPVLLITLVMALSAASKINSTLDDLSQILFCTHAQYSRQYDLLGQCRH